MFHGSDGYARGQADPWGGPADMTPAQMRAHEAWWNGDVIPDEDLHAEEDEDAYRARYGPCGQVLWDVEKKAGHWGTRKVLPLNDLYPAELQAPIACDLANALCSNTVVLNVSVNGVTVEACRAWGNTLKKNNTLKVLDLTLDGAQQLPRGVPLTFPSTPPDRFANLGMRETHMQTMWVATGSSLGFWSIRLFGPA